MHRETDLNGQLHFFTFIIFLPNIVMFLRNSHAVKNDSSQTSLHCTVMIVTYRPCDCKIFLTQNVIHVNLRRTPDRGNGDDGRLRVFADGPTPCHCKLWKHSITANDRSETFCQVFTTSHSPTSSEWSGASRRSRRSPEPFSFVTGSIRIIQMQIRSGVLWRDVKRFWRGLPAGRWAETLYMLVTRHQILFASEYS